MENEMIEMEKEDHFDLVEMMAGVNNNDVPEDMAILWEQQKDILQTSSSKGYRWHPRIMKMCVEMYSKNPHVLDPLRKVIHLPSNRTIRHYKNKTEQTPGWNVKILRWCLQEAKDNNLKDQDYWGGFVLDEMKIQENIEMVVKNGKHRLVGFVDLGEIHENMQQLSGKPAEPQLATHVLQFIFVGDSGFRFPIAQFPSCGCTPSDLFFIFWDGVQMMFETGFQVYWCILDGAEVNRQFVKLHFKDEKEISDNKFVVPNVSTGGTMVFMMDPKHNFKKIRNNILKSTLDSNNGTRCLSIGDKNILWEQFVNAFHYDQGEFSLSYNEKLTLEHFELDPASKMRNHLAEEVLDRDMLSLMKGYHEEPLTVNFCPDGIPISPHQCGQCGYQGANANDLSDFLCQHVQQCTQRKKCMYVLCKMDDNTTQIELSFLNKINLYKDGTPIMPLKNHLKALRRMVFDIVRDLADIRELPEEVPGFQVNLMSALVWSIREKRLHGCATDEMEFHLKLDGRPLFGKEQISIGIVPAKHPYLPSQSSKAVSTLAIANCKENSQLYPKQQNVINMYLKIDRENIKVMLQDINAQKDHIKTNGIHIDGKLYQIKFKVILDYKGFCLLLAKEKDECFQLGGKGLDVEFCMFCHAMRLCTNCDLGPNEVCLEHFSMTKANIGGFQGIRDDLTFLLNEDMSSINICALHCELRNMEHLLASLGLLSYEIGSLKECNKVLASYGPQTFKGDRITIKTKPGQLSAVQKHNVQVCSFTGSTERAFLENCEEIIQESLPKDKMIETQFKSRETAELFILNQVEYCQDRVKVCTYESLCNNLFYPAIGIDVKMLFNYWSEKMKDISEKFEKLCNDTSPPQTKKKVKKRRKKKDLETIHDASSDDILLRELAAELMIEQYFKVFTEWKCIALTIRNEEFSQDEEHLIDKFDLK
ncbi:hypothetical protein QZH41_012782, partial [Actinostola sp. cb2023]